MITWAARSPGSARTWRGAPAQELEADCYAAARLAATNRASVEAAVQFFTRMGLFSP
jgi:hypothetical protein